MESRMQWWARIALGASLALVGLGFLMMLYGVSHADGGEASSFLPLRVLDVLSEITAVLAILANLLAFCLALGCRLKGANKVPWVVLSISSLGLCYCMYFVLAACGVVA